MLACATEFSSADNPLISGVVCAKNTNDTGIAAPPGIAVFRWFPAKWCRFVGMKQRGSGLIWRLMGLVGLDQALDDGGVRP